MRQLNFKIVTRNEKLMNTKSENVTANRENCTGTNFFKIFRKTWRGKIIDVKNKRANVETWYQTWRQTNSRHRPDVDFTMLQRLDDERDASTETATSTKRQNKII